MANPQTFVPTTSLQVSMQQPEKAPIGSIKWKALYDSANPHINKILIRNTHTQDLLPWKGFVRQRGGKDLLYTRIPLTTEQHNIIAAIEHGVQAILQQYDWCQSFSITPTQGIFPRTENCIFYEKKEDGRLYRTNPDPENELCGSSEKSLSIGALLHITGVFFDFATHQAKLTFRMVSATYAWTDNITAREEVYESYLSVFGEIASPSLPVVDIVEAAVLASDVPATKETECVDKPTFSSMLAKTRTVGGIQKRLKQIQRHSLEAGFKEWAEEEANKAMLAVAERGKKKAEKKKAKLNVFVPTQSTAAAPPPQHPMDVSLVSETESDEE